MNIHREQSSTHLFIYFEWKRPRVLIFWLGFLLFGLSVGPFGLGAFCWCWAGLVLQAYFHQIWSSLIVRSNRMEDIISLPSSHLLIYHTSAPSWCSKSNCTGGSIGWPIAKSERKKNSMKLFQIGLPIWESYKPGKSIANSE